MLTLSCASSSTAPPPNDCNFDAIFAATDNLSSSVGGVSSTTAQRTASGVDLGKDPVLSTSAGRLFFIARDQDVLFEIDSRCGTTKTRIGLGDPSRRGSTNPQDVAITPSGDLLVPRFKYPELVKYSPRGEPIAKLDLSTFDTDGNPNASAVVTRGGKAFVALERLDDTDHFKSKQESWLVRVDLASFAVDGKIVLAARNPFGLIDSAANLFYLAAPGRFDLDTEGDAGIERIDPDAMTSTLLVSEKLLGASVVEVAVTKGCGAAIVADPSVANVTSLVTFDPESGAVLRGAKAPVIGPTEGFDLRGLVWTGKGELIVGDRRRRNGGYGAHVFRRDGACTLQETRIVDLPHPPIAFKRTESPAL